MAEIIHTRKGKYQYKYEHTREGDKIVSKYMYPVDGAGDKVKPYQERVAQQTEPEHKRVTPQKTYYGVVVSSLGEHKIYPVDIVSDHKPKIEYAGIGAYCKWHTSKDSRNKYIAQMINKGYSLDIVECDKYYKG